MRLDYAAEGFRYRDEDIALPPIHILKEDYEILADIVCASPAPTPGVELLWRELQRAVILRTDRAPSDLVHLNSKVRYTDLVHPLKGTVRIVNPQDDPIFEDRELSVATSLGAALIGLRVGDRFPWVSARDGVRMVRVDRVDADPFRAARRKAVRAAAKRRLVDELLSLS